MDLAFGSGVGLLQGHAQGLRHSQHGPVTVGNASQTRALEPPIRQQSWAGEDLHNAQKFAPTVAVFQQAVADGQHMKALHIAMPTVLMRVNHIKATVCLPGRGQGEPQLIDPSGAAQRAGNFVWHPP